MVFAHVWVLSGEECPVAGVERFEDFTAWKKARALTRAVYDVTQRGAFTRDFGLSGQIQRASVSIMSNIAEGFERGSRGEFQQFLSIAKASCAEVRSLLYVAVDTRYIEEAIFDRLHAQAQEVAALVGGLRTSVESQPHPRLRTRANGQ
jgi:four helix bundle protein